MKLIPLTKGQVAIVDDEDFDRLNKWKWCANETSPGEFYAMRNSRPKGSKPSKIYMHREIVDASPEDFVDHRHKPTTDNRKENIRAATPAQNLANRGPQKNGTSGYKGVTWKADKQKWRAQIRVEGIDYFLGYFNSPILAALRVDEEAKKLLGEFAFLNFPTL